VAQALLTTAFGLAVAIPALLVYYIFVSRVDKLVTEIDSLGQELVHLVSAEELHNREESRGEKAHRAGKRESAGKDAG
jgi:biopolymer transport protein ExbB